MQREFNKLEQHPSSAPLIGLIAEHPQNDQNLQKVCGHKAPQVE
jgi:hypothetical protein